MRKSYLGLNELKSCEAAYALIIWVVVSIAGLKFYHGSLKRKSH